MVRRIRQVCRQLRDDGCDYDERGMPVFVFMALLYPTQHCTYCNSGV